MSRLETRFKALKKEGRAGFVTFVTAGDPDPATSLAILKGMPAAGADIIELGMPFSDPMADGPAIQAASLRALAQGMNMVKTLAMVSEFRKDDNDTPIVLMGYYNPIYRYGVDKFLADAQKAGVDGLIVVDLPPEEENELAIPAQKVGIDFIYLTAPTTDDARLPRVVKNASGFVYYVSVTGVTGTASAAATDIEAAVKRLRKYTDLPLAVGFGIKTPAQAAEVAKVADAAVVGSALVNIIADHQKDGPKAAANVLKLVSDLAQGVRGARV